MAASRQRIVGIVGLSPRTAVTAVSLSGVYIYFLLHLLLYLRQTAPSLPDENDVFVCMYWGLVLEKKKAMW